MTESSLSPFLSATCHRTPRSKKWRGKSRKDASPRSIFDHSSITSKLNSVFKIGGDEAYVNWKSDLINRLMHEWSLKKVSSRWLSHVWLEWQRVVRKGKDGSSWFIADHRSRLSSSVFWTFLNIDRSILNLLKWNLWENKNERERMRELEICIVNCMCEMLVQINFLYWARDYQIVSQIKSKGNTNFR